MSTSRQTKDGELILDSHKLSFHMDRIKAWENGDKIAPVTVDMALTRACGSMCKFCYATMQESQKRFGIKEHHALNLLDDFAEIGVKGVSLVSDGESTLSKSYATFIEHASSIGIDTGNATNGWEFGPEKSERVLPHLSWLRFTVAAGTPERYADIMYKGPEHTEVFDKAIRNIKYAVEFKKKHNLSVTLGIQMVLMPEFKDEIIPFAQLGVDLGVDYAVIKHCSDDENNTLGIDYSQYESMYNLIETAENLSNDVTQVIAKWDKLKDKGESSYKRFYGPPFLLQISGSGLVAPSGMFFQATHSKLHIGNFTTDRFRDIYNSDKYWNVMDY
ncbi:MAG: radical SAM protein, partial [Candidatus Scalindua sp.]|nr:radical SAM protein [Candidatus Scalindua sp.]